MRLLLSTIFVLTCACSSQPAPTPPGEPDPGTPPVEPIPGDGQAACVPSGCSGTVCVEEGQEMVTTCEWKEEYACYQQATCERQPDGLCGWSMSPELEACLTAGGPQER